MTSLNPQTTPRHQLRAEKARRNKEAALNAFIGKKAEIDEHARAPAGAERRPFPLPPRRGGLGDGRHARALQRACSSASPTAPSARANTPGNPYRHWPGWPAGWRASPGRRPRNPAPPCQNRRLPCPNLPIPRPSSSARGPAPQQHCHAATQGAARGRREEGRGRDDLARLARRGRGRSAPQGSALARDRRWSWYHAGRHRGRARGHRDRARLPSTASAIRARRSRTPRRRPDRPDAPKPVAIRAGTKQAQIIALLQRPEGASIGEIVEATGWQAHSARGMISGALKKKLGLAITSRKEANRGTVYSLDA